jgi:hypothetical protein
MHDILCPLPIARFDSGNEPERLGEGFTADPYYESLF